MRLLKFLPLLLMLSCIDLITQKTVYNSLYFKGGSWIEIAPLDSMKMDTGTNDFTLQFWVSGGEVDTNEAPSLFSLIDPQDSIKLALLRDRGKTNTITIVINSETLPPKEINGLDWSDPDNFYLISFLFSDTKDIEIYLNDTNLIEPDFLPPESRLNVGDAKLMLGALVNEDRTILENFWYGYIDEVRLWNTRLADSTITFQYVHPEKLGDYYKYPYYDSLIGIWRFNLEKPITIIEDDSGFNNDGIIYTISEKFSVELSKKGAQ